MFTRIHMMACFALLAACDTSAGTSTGNPFEEGGPDVARGGEDDVITGGDLSGHERCEETSHDLPDLDTVPPLGFSPADVLALCGGRHELALRWLTDAELSYGPEQGAGALTLEIEYAGGAKRHVVSTRISSAGDVTPTIETICLDRIELEVRVHVRTEGGALDETFDTTLHATHFDTARFAERWDWGALGGTLHLEAQHGPLAESLAGPLWIENTFDLEGISGRLVASFESSGPDGQRDGEGDDVAGQHWVQLAVWPPEAGENDR